MSVLVFVEPGDELSLQALTLAQTLGDVRAVSIDGPYAPAAWAAAIVEAADGADAIVAAGSDRGNELLAHVAARLDQPFAANVTAVDGDVVTRIRWGGSLLEEARLHGSPKILTVAPHTQPAAEAVPVETLTAADDGSPRVLETVAESTGGVSLRDAKVVVSGGRGVGSAEGFAIIEELAGLLGGGGRLLARRHERGLASARRPGGADGHEDLGRSVRRVRHQRRDAAHRGREGREEDPRDQRRLRRRRSSRAPTTP